MDVRVNPLGDATLSIKREALRPLFYAHNFLESRSGFHYLRTMKKLNLPVTPITIKDEFSPLKSVIIGLGVPYQQDKEQVASEMLEFPLVPNTARKEEVLALTYPTEDILIPEYEDYVATLQKYDIEVLRADPKIAYSFDYTCPRDIGFVIGDLFFISNMSVASRADEYRTILHYLSDIDEGNIRRGPEEAIYEGGDVILLDEKTILVGINQRTNDAGFEYLRCCLSPLGYDVIPARHRQLHLDCCLNPLGRGHLLIHPGSLEGNSDDTWQTLKKFEWIEVDDIEREHLATNILSINPDTVLVRDHSACARVNQVLKEKDYTVEEITFDGVPATGGSFRCASLVLSRAG